MTADPIPNDYHDLLAELAEAAGAAQIDHWLLGTVARRNALPHGIRARLAGIVAAHGASVAAPAEAA